MGDALAEFRLLRERIVDMDFVVIAGQVGVAADQLVVDKLMVGALLADNEIGWAALVLVQ